jgi:hypothetical protein
MLKALILIALLGSDDFRTRERAHALVWEGMPWSGRACPTGLHWWSSARTPQTPKWPDDAGT